MTLKHLLSLIPATTPIRIYREGNPYEPLVSLIYADELSKGDLNIMFDTVSSIGVAVRDGLAYSIIWVR